MITLSIIIIAAVIAVVAIAIMVDIALTTVLISCGDIIVAGLVIFAIIRLIIRFTKKKK